MNRFRNYLTNLSGQLISSSNNDCYSALSPAIGFYQITGFLPLSLKGVLGDRKYAKSFGIFAYTVALQVLIITALIIWLKSSISDPEKSQSRNVLTVAYDIAIGVEISTTIITFVSVTISREKLAIAINFLCERDEEFKNIGILFDYWKDFKRPSFVRILIILTITLTLLIYDFTYKFEINLRQPIHWITWIIPPLVQIISTSFFADIIFVIMKKFRAVNQNLRIIIRESKKNGFKVQSARLRTHLRIRSISMIHGNLCESVKNFNQIFSPNMIVGVIFAIVNVASSMYYFIHGIKSSNRNYLRMFVYVNWAMIHSLHIVHIVLVCSVTENEARLTGKLIHKLDLDGKDLALNNAIQNFSLQLDQQRLAFSAAGLFELNTTLIRSIVGTVTTYLIIMIQFDTTTP